MIAGGTSKEVCDDIWVKRVHIEPEEVAKAVIFILSTPPHVNVGDF